MPRVKRRLVAVGAATVVLATTALVVVLVVLVARRPEVVVVAPGRDVTAVARSHPGDVLLLAPGRHRAFRLLDPVTVRGAPGSRVEGGVEVRAGGTRLEDLSVHGGGVLVRDVDDVVIDGVSVTGADLHGIEVVDASARITDCRIRGLASPFAQGIEVRNANSRPRTTVRRCTVVGGQEGIVAHVSRVDFEDNRVTGTTLRAIAVTEMSEGVVAGNHVAGVTGVGVWCGDMSHCEVRGNRVDGVAAADNGARSSGGHGVAASFHSTLRAEANRLDGLAGRPVGLFTGSVRTERFPLMVWPPGWRGLLSGVPYVIAAGAALALLARAGRSALGRRRPSGASLASSPGVDPLVAGAVLGGFAVQSFHMVEHVVQAWQVFVAEGEHRSGLLGATFDVEWVHLIFNVAVLAFLVSVWRIGRTQGWLAGSGGAVPWVLAGVALQGYHLVEHLVRMGQHLVGGVPRPPGLLGQVVDLTWLHFAINTAVWFATGVAVVAMIRSAASMLAGRAGPRTAGPEVVALRG